MALAVMKLANAGTDLQVAKALSRPYVGPFPDFPRPSAGECRDVKVALEALHGPIQRLNDSHIDSSFKPVEAPQVLKLEVEAKQHLNSRSGDIKEQSRGGLGMLTQGNPEEGGSKRIKEESKDALQSELLADHQEGGLRTPEVKSSKRSKFSPSLAYVGAGSAEVKVEDGECDLKSGPSPGFLADEARPSAAGGSGVRKAKEQPMDYEAGFTGAAGIPTSAPNNDQTPQRLLRSQTKAIKKGIVKKESSPNPSSEVDQQKPSRSRGKPAGSRKRSFQESQQEPLLIVAPVTPQSQGVIGRGTKSHPSGQFDLSLSETTSPHSPQASGLPLTLTSAPLQIPPVPLGGSADQSSVLDSLVRTILSQNTTDTNSKRAFASLKLAFPTWEDVRAAGPGPLAASIKSGGLAEIKARRILDILDYLASKYGVLELEHLRSMSDEQVKAELSQFKGVGPKTVACVLMFCLDRHEFPVDTHVWRISKRLGWVPQTADREATYLHLNQRVPDDLKYDLHCLLVGHGKKCPGCAKGGRPQKAPDGPCPLTPWIRGAGKGDKK